ncbi:2-keto-3-deoxy-galactonokinase [Pseudomonas savastanoi pv. savastanoi]|nr:2-keto-3-deoxy-galactonokinase [Pseudomonas savastanoi pv. savastanoi]
MQAQLIALDWGTTSLRAYRLGEHGQVLEQRALSAGIMQLPTTPRLIAGQFCSDGFELAFDQACGDWLDAQPDCLWHGRQRTGLARGGLPGNAGQRQ